MAMTRHEGFWIAVVVMCWVCFWFAIAALFGKTTARECAEACNGRMARYASPGDCTCHPEGS